MFEQTTEADNPGVCSQKTSVKGRERSAGRKGKWEK